MKWRTVGESVCVCSFYAPHPGIDVNVRVAFWQELTATVRQERSTVDLPSFPCFMDNFVVPFIDLLTSSCGPRLINPPDQATHVVGAALDLVLISSHCPCSMLVHSGLQCCVEAPGCCPKMVASASLIHNWSRPVSTSPPSAELVLAPGLAECSLASNAPTLS